MRLHRIVAKTGPRVEHLEVADDDRAAPCFQDSLGLEDLNDAAGVAAAYAQHRRKLLVRQRQNVGPGAFHRRYDPLGGALLDRVDRIAGGRLKYLGEKTIGVAAEEISKRRRF